MNAPIHLLAAAAVALAIAAPAAANIPTGNIGVDVQSAVGSAGTVHVTLENGTATLTGHTDGLLARDAAVAAAADADGVTDVVDLIHPN